MAAPTVTHTFTNGTTADATQVNQNFTDLINTMTDGSKTFSIDALTCAGAVALNGTVGLGNATGDDISINGYVATDILPKTDATYDLGSATKQWCDLYTKGTTSLDGAVTITGFTKLGDTVALKCKKVIGTTPTNSTGDQISTAAHNLTVTKIVGFSAQVYDSGNSIQWLPSVTLNASYQYDAYIDASNVNIKLLSGKGGGIFSKDFVFLVWYIA